MDLGLKGLRAILVGANGGIGRVVAQVLSNEGCAIALCGRSQDKVDKVLSEIAGSGVETYGESVDVTQVEAVPAFVDKAAAALGGCDIFISFTSTNLGEDTDAAWDAVMQADILPMRRGIAAARPYLAISDNAAIVCISSAGAVEEFMGVQPYNALKAAVMNYSSALSQSLAGEGIRVNCITPGPVMTEDGPWANLQQAAPEFYDATLANMPSGRFTTGEELAKAIAFVVSPACKAMTGANIVVDNGYTKRTQF
jgi:NAD(P)-dependent dehydrogenase (short-subunit alcohol dehydrogenase family)